MRCCPNFSAAQANVRIVDGTVETEGRVEVNIRGAWRTVCDTNWDLQDADVVCKELRYGYAISAVTGAYFGQGTGSPPWVGANCTGNEASITRCTEAMGGTCSHTKDAGIVCSPSGKHRYILPNSHTVLHRLIFLISNHHYHNGRPNTVEPA